MKNSIAVQTFLALLEAQDFDGMPKFIVATASGELDVLSVYVVDGNIVIDVEEPEAPASSPPAVGMLLLTYDAKKAVSYKDIIHV